ncbi:MAG: glycosyltransferase [Endomicrobiales bacterium]|jgi:N-acetylgalactosamine-N,N'-diacetylbacillosaminyl-diphospho-undecaprenol 4-alpha-N-acetylgalactosaminyltransferase
MTRKKVVCVINSISGGGAEQVLQYIARYYQRDRFSFEICVLHATGREKELIPHDVPVHFLHNDRAGWYIGALVRLVFVIVRSKPSVLFSLLVKSNIVASIAGRMTGVPVVVSEHGPTHVYINDYSFPRVARWVLARTYGSARSIVAVSQAGRDSFISVFPHCRDKVSVIYNGVDVEGIRSKASQSQSVIAGPYLVSCGRLSPEKNYSLLIESVAALKNIYSLDYSLCIAGEGQERDDLACLARQRGVRLIMPGFLDNPYPVMAGAHAFVMTSRYESFPLVALEAMVCGTTVVTVDCPGGIREVLHDGENSRVVDSMLPEDVARALHQVLTDNQLAHRFKDAAARDVTERFSVHTMAAHYEDILSKES